ncbi:LAME_0E04522g1_1 [Lachancea meyersii CBS 8951]|uniref:LAME_0E04522g1_1 n=1 Tax=Lachancea meyersii CBS 8951 TaxID=1266667 RepID=A0A1G4JGX4_9SACH|nr:LAME_0E04522g1_1 [Lachancea meyersii CBS 8951]
MNTWMNIFITLCLLNSQIFCVVAENAGDRQVNRFFTLQREHVRTRMRYKLESMLFGSVLVMANLGREPQPQPKLSFVCPPIKASSLQVERAQQEKHTCVSFETGSNSKTATFTIEVIDYLDHKLDLNRFGPTSCELGRQRLDFTAATSNGDLLRSHRNLKSGRTAIQVEASITNLHFEFCFSNLVYDSSWRSVDMHKAITITLVNQETTKPHVSDRISKKASDAAVDAANMIFSLVSEQDGQQLYHLENERRDLNESTFSWLLGAQLALMLLVAIITIVSVRCLALTDKPAILSVASSTDKCS